MSKKHQVAQLTYKDAQLGGIEKLLAHISDQPDMSKTVSLLAVETDMTEPQVEYWIDRARQQGHLVVNEGRGYYIATTYAAFNAWRKREIIPQLVHTLDMLRAMGMTAKEQFGTAENEQDRILPFGTG